MKIVAVYKTFRGHEFATASLESIYPYVDKVIYAHSSIGWDGRTGNTVAPEIVAWKLANDKLDKIVNLNFNTTVQKEQYAFIGDFIASNGIAHDKLMLIDTDEVWDKAGLEATLQEVASVDAQAYKCGCYTYVKSPFFRTLPQPTIYPVGFLTRGAGFGKCRGTGVRPVHTVSPVGLHHFCAVRESFTEAWGKHVASCGSECAPMIDKRLWLDKWNGLPGGTNLLPLQHAQEQWSSVRVVSTDDLPETVRSMTLVKAWAAYTR